MLLLLGLFSLVCGHTHTYRPHEKFDVTEELKDFHIIYPDVVHGKPEGSTHHSRILSGNQNDVPGHTQALALEFKAYGKTMRLELTQTADLFSKDFTITNHNIDGTVTHVHPEHCYYHGHVTGLEGSSVTGSTCHGFDGMITSKDERYVIMPAAEDKKLYSRLKHTLGTKMPSKDGSKLGPHVIFKFSDMKQPPSFGCGNGHSHSHSHETTETAKTAKTALAKTALTKITKIEEKQLSRKLLADSNFVELLIVNDADQVAKTGGTTETSEFAIQVANGVKTLYQTFNLDVNIVLTQVKNFEVDTQESFRTELHEDIETYLDRFTQWYKDDTSKKDNAQLISGGDRSGGAGIAWVGGMCGQQNVGINENGGGNWQAVVHVMAHEMGHNWGMRHDNEPENARCDNSQHLMAPSSGGKKTWSDCSKSYLSATLQRLENLPGNCLKNNPGVGIGASQVCGDGIKSDNEECDEGGDNGANGKCSTSCKLNQDMQCTSGECCENGTFKAAGSMCRDAMHQCDLADRCMGNSAQCPSDNYKPDGTACTESGAGSTCYRGSCMGLGGQCMSAFTGIAGRWLPSYTSDKCQCDCMNVNPCGDLRCADNDFHGYCKTVFCREGQFCGFNGAAKQPGPANVHYCVCGWRRGPSSETKLKVKDGTPCGTGQMCFNGECSKRPISVAALQTCASDCGSNGKCAQNKDSAFACVCAAGYAGNKCANKVACGTDCSLLNRETCVVDNMCGSCLTGTGSATSDDTTGLSNCSLTKSNIVGSFSLTRGVDASKDMIDGDVYTHWVESFSSDKEATVHIVLDKPAQVSRYDMISSNSRPAEDPASFTLHGSNDCVTWHKLHSQSTVKFTRRHESRSFLIKDSRPFTVIKLSIKEVADPNSQNQAMMSPITNVTNTAANEVTFTTAVEVSQLMSGKILTVQLAEFKLYHQQDDTSSMTPITKEQCQKALSVDPNDPNNPNDPNDPNNQANGASPAFTLATLAILLPIIAAIGN